MRRNLIGLAAALCAVIGTAAPALADPGNVATNSTGTAQIGAVTASPTATVASPAGAVTVAAPTGNPPSGAAGGNNASNSTGTVQASPATVDAGGGAAVANTTAAVAAPVTVGGGGTNKASNSTGTAQVGGGNSASGSTGTAQVSGLSTAPSGTATAAGNTAGIAANTGIGGTGGNDADNSTGTAQLGGNNAAPGSAGTVQSGGPIFGLAAFLNNAQATVPASVGGTGGNNASQSTGTAQVGGGNNASESAGTVQSAGASTAPSAAGPVVASVPVSIGGTGGNQAGNSTGTVQVGGANSASNSTATLQSGPTTFATAGVAGGGEAAGPTAPAGAAGTTNTGTTKSPLITTGAKPLPVTVQALGGTVTQGRPHPLAAQVTARNPISRLARSATRAMLPFTGILLFPWVLLGLALLLTGVVLRRRSQWRSQLQQMEGGGFGRPTSLALFVVALAVAGGGLASTARSEETPPLCGVARPVDDLLRCT